LRREIGKASPHNRAMVAGQREMAIAPQAGSIPPPPAVFHVTDEVRTKYARQDYAVGSREGIKFRKQTLKIVDEIEGRKVRRDEVDVAVIAYGFARQKLSIRPAGECDLPRLDEFPTMRGKILAHCRINVIRLDGKTAFRVEPCIDARPRSEIKNYGAWARRPQNEILKRRACATIRLQHRDCFHVIPTRMTRTHMTRRSEADRETVDAFADELRSRGGEHGGNNRHDGFADGAMLSLVPKRIIGYSIRRYIAIGSSRIVAVKMAHCAGQKK
jgi:hypothetical protein